MQYWSSDCVHGIAIVVGVLGGVKECLGLSVTRESKILADVLRMGPSVKKLSPSETL